MTKNWLEYDQKMSQQQTLLIKYDQKCSQRQTLFISMSERPLFSL